MAMKTFTARSTPGRTDTCLRIPQATNSSRHCGPWRRDKIGFPRKLPAELASRKLLEELTSREVEVLNQLAKGLANKEIADALNITEYTVKDHLKSILAKLRVADRTEAVTTSIQRGIIHL